MAQAFSIKDSSTQMWDDKFGMIDHHEFDDLKEKNMDEAYIKKVIEGVGRDAEIITNSMGGKQSKTPMAMHLVDPRYLEIWAINNSDECTTDEGICCFDAIYWIARFMQSGNKDHLCFAISGLEPDELQATIRIAKVLQIGADRYEANNWRLIPQESHINHALIHIIAHLAGDRQDEHIDHALCRLMMAHATEKSEGFEYGEYVKKEGK